MIIWQRKAFSSQQFSIQCPAADRRLIINLVSSKKKILIYLRTLSMFDLVASGGKKQKRKKRTTDFGIMLMLLMLQDTEYSCDMYVKWG